MIIFTNEFQPINIADGEEEIIVIKKTKKVKKLTKKFELIIEDEENGPDQSIVSEHSDIISCKSIIPDSFEDTQSIVKKYLSLSVPAVLGFFLI